MAAPDGTGDARPSKMIRPPFTRRCEPRSDRRKRSLIPQCLVWSDGVVDVAVAVDFHVEGVAVTDEPAVEVLVFQGAEEPFDHTVGLGRADAGADVTVAEGRRR